MIKLHRFLPLQPALLTAFLLISSASLNAADAPWRLTDALNLSEGFSLSGEYQPRFEHFSDNVQLGASPNDRIVFLRTTLNAQYNRDRFSAQFEIQDARQQKADKDADIRNSHVSVMDVLQANVGFKFGRNQSSELKIGRFTEDWGSRTLVARNRYRNTINTFDGALFTHRQPSGNEFKVMSTQVVRRTPRDRISLLDNDRETDHSSEALRFHGVFANFPDLTQDFIPALGNLNLETYYLFLDEKDTQKVQTRNRNLHTVGFRLRSTPTASSWDINIESIFQTGTRRESTSSADTNDLDHTAFSQRIELAYSFDMPSRLRAIFEFNYASGDDDPLDQDSGRFDSLLGVTAFEFGPVALYAPMNRSNMISPGLRLTSTPWQNVSLMADYRHFWLAESKDSLGRTGLRDRSGNTDRYMGQHLEFRVRWSAIPGNLRIDSGFVFLQAKNLSDLNSEFFYIGSKIDF